MSIANISSENRTEGIDTDFTVKLKKPMMRAIGLQLLNVTVPLSYHIIPEGENKLHFSLQCSPSHPINIGKTVDELHQFTAIITPGNYTPEELIDELQKVINYAIELRVWQSQDWNGDRTKLPAEFQSGGAYYSEIDPTDEFRPTGHFLRYLANKNSNMWKHQVRVHRRNRSQKLQVRDSYGEYPTTANDPETNLSTFAQFKDGGRSGSDIPASLTDLYFAKGGRFMGEIKDVGGNIVFNDIIAQPIGTDLQYKTGLGADFLPGTEGFETGKRDENVKLYYETLTSYPAVYPPNHKNAGNPHPNPGSAIPSNLHYYNDAKDDDSVDYRVFPELYTPGVLCMYDKIDDEFIFSVGEHLDYSEFSINGWNETVVDDIGDTLISNSIRILKLLGFNHAVAGTDIITKPVLRVTGTDTNPKYKYDKNLENTLYSTISPEISGPSVLYMRLGGDILLDQQNTESNNNDRIPIPLDQPHGSVVHYENADKADLIPFSVPCDVSKIKIRLEAGDTNEVIGGNTGLRGHHFYARFKFYFAHSGGPNPR